MFSPVSGNVNGYGSVYEPSAPSELSYSPEQEVAQDLGQQPTQDYYTPVKEAPGQKTADQTIQDSIKKRVESRFAESRAGLQNAIANLAQRMGDNIDSTPLIRGRLTQIRDEFLSDASSTARNEPRNTSFFSRTYNSHSFSFWNFGGGGGRSPRNDDRMSVVVQIVSVVVFIGGALFFAGLDGKYTRRIDEANNSSRLIQDGTNPTDRALLRGLNTRIISISQAKQWHSRFGLAFTITGIAAAAFASYPLMWVAVLGCAATGISAVHRYASNKFTEIPANDSTFFSLVGTYGFDAQT